MILEKETENKIREKFRRDDFQDFMFESVFDSSKDEYDELYRNVYEYELQEIENELIFFVKCHIHHNIPINRNSIVLFVLENIVENLGDSDLDCKNIKFDAFCNQLYYMLFDIINKSYVFKNNRTLLREENKYVYITTSLNNAHKTIKKYTNLGYLYIDSVQKADCAVLKFENPNIEKENKITDIQFHEGDFVEDINGKIGYISSICHCDKCKERGFYEPTIWERKG